MSSQESASTEPTQKLYNMQEAATRLGIAPEVLDEWRKEGKIRATRIGSEWMFQAQDVWSLAATAADPAAGAAEEDAEAVDLIDEPSRGRPAEAVDDSSEEVYVAEVVADDEPAAPAKKGGMLWLLIVLLIVCAAVAGAVHFGGLLG